MGNNSFRFKVGDFNCIAVNTMDEGNFIALLIDTGQHQVLIDPGLGADFFPGTTNHGLLGNRLGEMKMSPAVFDLVIFSHADMDHICGGVDVNGKAAFPNARYVLLKEEWAFWSSKPPIRLLPNEAYDENFRQVARDVPQARLDQLADRLELVDSETEVVPGIRVIAATGHTPGHMCIAVSSGKERLLFIGDLFYNPEEIEDPEWYAIYDYDPPQAIATRHRILAQAARERTLLMGYHLPFPGLGYVTQQGAGWRWAADKPVV